MELRPGSTGEHRLQDVIGTTARACAFYDNQMLDRLNLEMQSFIGEQEMVFVATADAHGATDCSFRAGPSGFVRVIDEKTLMYPEYRGNGVMASAGNILRNPHVAMLFIDFFQHTIGLHVNGKAQIVDNAVVAGWPALPEVVRQDLTVTGGRAPERWIIIAVEEAYIHCSKHIPLLQKLDKSIAWGTDDVKRKGGDFFKAKHATRPWRLRKSTPATKQPARNTITLPELADPEAASEPRPKATVILPALAAPEPAIAQRPKDTVILPQLTPQERPAPLKDSFKTAVYQVVSADD